MVRGRQQTQSHEQHHHCIHFHIEKTDSFLCVKDDVVKQLLFRPSESLMKDRMVGPPVCQCSGSSTHLCDRYFGAFVDELDHTVRLALVRGYEETLGQREDRSGILLAHEAAMEAEREGGRCLQTRTRARWTSSSWPARRGDSVCVWHAPALPLACPR